MKKNVFLICILVLISSCFSFLCACSFFQDESTKVDTVTIKMGTTYNWYQGKGYSYSSSDTDIATVSKVGLITGVSNGKCKIKAINGKTSYAINVVVLYQAVSPSKSSTTSSSQTSLASSSVNSSSQNSSVIEPKVYFTLDAQGGVISSAVWQEKNGLYVTYQQESLPTPEKTGYNFVRWESNGGTITSLTEGGSAVAVWEEKSYQVEYVLNGGTNSSQNPISYKYFDEPFSLYPAEKSGYDFIGWYLDSNFKTKTTVIPNTKEKVVLYAYFDTQVKATCIYNGINYETFSPIGGTYSKPIVEVEDGYFIEWFTDEECTTSYNFALTVEDNITLYGKKYKELTPSFFGYEGNKLTKVNSLEEFQYYLEYSYYNEISEDNYVEVSEEVYNHLTNATSQELSLLLNKSTMPFIRLSRSNYTSGGKYYYQVLITEKVPETFLTQTFLEKFQYDYVERGDNDSFTKTRSADFDNFKYEEIAREVIVENSNHLFFALEHRLKPIPMKDSPAEKALNACKEILRNVCNDDMSDVEKVLRLYRYMCYNVTYNLPAPASGESSLQYDAFYIEGVVNNNQAVCDGICKTFSVLCNLEGIRCVRAASTSHAWNEVFINGNWYTIDITHGNLTINETEEVLTYDNFLINETVKESLGYKDILRTEIIADGEYNYYSENTFEYNSVTYDFVITSTQELGILLKWIKQEDLQHNYDKFSVNFVMDYSYFNFSSEFSAAANYAGGFNYSINLSNKTINNKPNYILILS